MPLWQFASINTASQMNKAIPILLAVKGNTDKIKEYTSGIREDIPGYAMQLRQMQAHLEPGRMLSDTCGYDYEICKFYGSSLSLPKASVPKSVTSIGQNDKLSLICIIGIHGLAYIFADNWLYSCVAILFPDLLDLSAGYFHFPAISLVVTPFFFSRIIQWIFRLFNSYSNFEFGA
jgi:hypothetical protein